MKTLKNIVTVFALAIFLLTTFNVFGQKVKKTPEQLNILKQKVDDPSKLDKVVEELGIQPKLMNFYLATPVDLGNYGLKYGKGVHIPIQISKKYGGRESVYFLPTNKKTLIGLFIAGENIILRYVTRLTGKTKKAVDGDLFKVELETIKGKTLFKGTGKLKIIDGRYGYGELNFQNSKAKSADVWIIWSCIYITH